MYDPNRFKAFCKKHDIAILYKEATAKDDMSTIELRHAGKDVNAFCDDEDKIGELPSGSEIGVNGKHSLNQMIDVRLASWERYQITNIMLDGKEVRFKLADFEMAQRKVAPMDF